MEVRVEPTVPLAPDTQHILNLWACYFALGAAHGGSAQVLLLRLLLTLLLQRRRQLMLQLAV
jgi:hypothetical protein